MSAEEFWHGHPRLAVAYREADVLRRDRADQAAWQAGLYTAHAVSTALGGDEKAPYPQSPLFGSAAIRAEYERRAEEAATARAREAFEELAARVNRRFEEQGGAADE